MTTEVTLVRLPVRLSDLVDEAVGEFIDTHGKEKVEGYRRYHGADLWMVYAHEPVASEAEPAFLTRRVTIAAYSDDPDHLRFIPDIVVTTPGGRFTLPFDPGKDGSPGNHVEPVSALQVRLATEPQATYRDLLDEQYPGSVAAALKRAWHDTKRLGLHQATQLIP